MDRDFDHVLHQIRNSGEQKALESRDLRARYVAFGWSLAFGLLVLLATAAYFMNVTGWAAVVLGVIAIAMFVAWDRACLRSVLFAKEQDRRYFLTCIRNAHSIDELNRAGLFAYLPESSGPSWVASVGGEVGRLRKALNVEPEWSDWH